MLNDAERAAKHAILAATPAYMLADLDELASTLAKFEIFVPRGGGTTETVVVVHIRIGLFGLFFRIILSVKAAMTIHCSNLHH